MKMKIYYETGYLITESEDGESQGKASFKEALEYALEADAKKIEIISHGGYTFKDILNEMESED